MKKREKKICFDIWCSNGFTCSLFLRSKLVIFNNFWTCLVFPQNSGDVTVIYPIIFNFYIGSKVRIVDFSTIYIYSQQINHFHVNKIHFWNLDIFQIIVIKYLAEEKLNQFFILSLRLKKIMYNSNVIKQAIKFIHYFFFTQDRTFQMWEILHFLYSYS